MGTEQGEAEGREVAAAAAGLAPIAAGGAAEAEGRAGELWHLFFLVCHFVGYLSGKRFRKPQNTDKIEAVSMAGIPLA